jgi:hypothetical protein
MVSKGETIMTLHKKQLGTLGEVKIIADLISKGYEVFKEIGDNSKVDLVVLDKNYKAWKIQVKTYHSNNGVVSLCRYKSGPGYSFQYQPEHADIYAVFLPDEDLICYVPAPVLMGKERALTIRITAAKNNNQKLVNNASDYFDFERALRDCTQSP